MKLATVPIGEEARVTVSGVTSPWGIASFGHPGSVKISVYVPLVTADSKYL